MNAIPSDLDLSAMSRPALERYAGRVGEELAVLAAVLGGDRTVAQISETTGVTVGSGLLSRLVCRDLLLMQVVDGQWHYLPVVHQPGARKGGTR